MEIQHAYPTASVLDQSAVAVPLTGTTTETTLATITVPAGAMGANGQVEIVALWTHTNSANNKILRAKFGGSTVMSATLTTTASTQSYTRVANRNSVASQVTLQNAQGFVPGTSTAVSTLTVDTSADVSIVLTGQLANTGETITLESYYVRVLPKS